MPKLPLCCLTLLMLLAACAPARPAQAPTEPAGGVLFATHHWTNSPAEQETLQGIIDNFAAINQVTIILEPHHYVAKDFGQQAAAGLGPDMVIGLPYEEIIPLAEAGLLKSLSPDAISQIRYAPAHLKALTYQDRLYGLPFMGFTSVLYYNKNQVDEPPSTLTGLLTEAEAGRPVAIPTNFKDAYWGIPAFGGHLFDDQFNLTLTPQSYAAWFSWLKSAQGQPGLVFDNDAALLEQKFIEGEVAYLVASSAQLSRFQMALGEKSVGVSGLPHPDSERETELAPETGSAGPFFELQTIVFSRAADEETVRIGLELAEFLHNLSPQRKLALAETGRGPTNRRAFIRSDLSEIGHAVVRQSRSASLLPLDYLNSFNQIQPAADALYLELLEGDLGAQEAADQLVNLLIEHY